MRRKSLLLTVPRRLNWVDEELPEPGRNELLVETLAGAISIGTELPHYLGTSRGLELNYPAMTGYESVGQVLRVGGDVRDFAPDDRIVSFYGHRTRAIVPVEKAIPVPAGVSDEIALLSILSCDVAKGIRKLESRPGDHVLITGGGTIGLLALWTLKEYGVEHIDLVEPLAERRQLAWCLGATGVFGPDALDPIASGYAFGVECSSRDAAFALLQRSVRQDGAICVLADGNLEPLTLTPEFHRKELRVIGSSDGWDYHAHARWFFERTKEKEQLLTQFFQWHVAAGELVDAFARLATAEPRPVKVLVRYRNVRTC